MAKTSRLVTTTVLGLVFGVICMFLSRYTAGVAFWPIGVSFLLHHIVMGLVIGMDPFRMSWVTHGIFWGIIFGSFLAISRVGTTQDPWIVFIAVIVWGFLIETLATKAFKQPQ